MSSPANKNPSRTAHRATKKTSRRASGTRIVRERDLTGYKYSPSGDIPESTPKPWYPLVVAYTDTPQEIDAGELLSRFSTQIDKDGKTFRTYTNATGGDLTLEVRLQRVEVWNLTGRAVSLTVWEPPTQDYSASNPGYTFNQLGGWTDAGGTDTFPRIGYVYPNAVQRQAHTINYSGANTNFKVITTTASSANDTLLHRFHIHWRAPGVTNYTTTLMPHTPAIQLLTRGIAGLKTTVEASTQKRSEEFAASTRNLQNLGTQLGNQISDQTTTIQGSQRVNIQVLRDILSKIPSSSSLYQEVSTIIEEFDICEDAPEVQSDS